MSLKRPAFQFYPSDWRKDMALQSCSVAARGLWIDMLCIAHECEPYGHLTVNGKAMTPAQIGRHTGLTQKECERLIAELDEAGVPSRTADGTIYSRRMVRDEDVRNRRGSGGVAGSEHGAKGADHGAKGGRPKKERGVLKPPLHLPEQPPLKPPEEPPPSSSSSSSSSISLSEDVEAAQRARAMAEPDGREPTPAGALCRALREKAGFTQCNPSDPRLVALLQQGATEGEFVAVAQEAVAKGSSWPWVLKVVQNRRAEAAAISLPARPAADPSAWKSSRDGVVNRACALGLGPFDEVAATTGDGPSWIEYNNQVLAADEAQRGAAA